MSSKLTQGVFGQDSNYDTTKVTRRESKHMNG